MTLRSALANSYNIPALLVQDAVGTKEVINTARALGITTELPEVASLTLGAGVVRLLDMTSAYGVFANGGVRVEPNPFLKITDSQDQVVYELKEPKGEQAIAPEVAYQVGGRPGRHRRARPMFGNVLDLNGRARSRRSRRAPPTTTRTPGRSASPPTGDRGVGGEHGQLPHAQGGRLPGRGLRLEGVHGHHPAGAAERALRRPARGGRGPAPAGIVEPIFSGSNPGCAVGAGTYQTTAANQRPGGTPAPARHPAPGAHPAPHPRTPARLEQRILFIRGLRPPYPPAGLDLPRGASRRGSASGRSSRRGALPRELLSPKGFGRSPRCGRSGDPCTAPPRASGRGPHVERAVPQPLDNKWLNFYPNPSFILPWAGASRHGGEVGVRVSAPLSKGARGRADEDAGHPPEAPRGRESPAGSPCCR